MDIRNCTRTDYDHIVSHVEDFWGSTRTRELHHPMFLYEFGDSAFVLGEGAQVAAYLLGLLAQTGPTAYVHLVGVRQTHRRQGLARRLYDHFTAFARARGCTALKAITTPANAASLAFHRALGMQLLGQPNREGIPVVGGYAGPGQDRVVFHRALLP
jgi:GNAT superfamily N-acetyltransferase